MPGLSAVGLVEVREQGKRGVTMEGSHTCLAFTAVPRTSLGLGKGSERKGV